MRSDSLALSDQTLEFVIKFFQSHLLRDALDADTKSFLNDFERFGIEQKYIFQSRSTINVLDAIRTGLTILNNQGIIMQFIVSKLDRRYSKFSDLYDFDRFLKVLNEILEYDNILIKEDKSLKFLDAKNKKTNWTGALWALADDLREKLGSEGFDSYEDCYEYGEKNFLHKGKPIKAKSLKNEYHKAKAAAKLN